MTRAGEEGSYSESTSSRSVACAVVVGTANQNGVEANESAEGLCLVASPMREWGLYVLRSEGAAQLVRPLQSRSARQALYLRVLRL
jgi:hypothetical protein